MKIKGKVETRAMRKYATDKLKKKCFVVCEKRKNCVNTCMSYEKYYIK